jgi:hydroxyethylthiazole kinase-like uncharacterized protein yjeF
LTDSLGLPRHEDDASKRDRGQVLVIGGCDETPGAVLLAGIAALRVGAGKLQIATSARAALPLAIAVPEARVLPMANVDDALVRDADGVLIGPGVLDDEGMDELLDLVLRNAQGTVVVDAGAIPALGRRADVAGATVIAVPNPGEIRHLGDEPATRLGITVSCRDAKTTITAPDGREWIEEAGSVGLATSGSGDVAAGIVVGLAARGATTEAAAIWGARLHGWAGERLPFGFLARDLLDQLPGLLPH